MRVYHESRIMITPGFKKIWHLERFWLFQREKKVRMPGIQRGMGAVGDGGEVERVRQSASWSSH